MPSPLVFHRRAAAAVSAASSSNFYAEVAADSPTIMWKYQEAGGASSFVDTMAGLTASSVGAGITAAVPGPGLATPWDKAVGFSGSGSYLSTPDNALFSAGMGAQGRAMTWETVRYVTDLGSTLRWFLAKGASGQYEYQIYVGANGRLDWAIALDGNFINAMQVTSAAAEIALNSWVHVIATCAMQPGGGSTRAYIYKNGSAIAGPGTPTTPGNSYGGDGTAAFLSGYRGDATYQPYQGKVACDIFYPTELSSARAAAHFAGLQSDGVMIPLVKDTFTRADSTTGLGSTEASGTVLGAVAYTEYWQSGAIAGHSWGVSSNNAYVYNGNGGYDTVAIVPTGLHDVQVTFTLADYQTYQCGVVIAWVSPTEYVKARVNKGDGAFYLEASSPGATHIYDLTTLASMSSVTVNDVYRIVVNGNSISVFRNGNVGTPQLTATTSVALTGTSQGLCCASAGEPGGPRIGSWEVWAA